MITKQQASQVADALIAQQQDLLNEKLHTKMRRVSFFYCSPELLKLPSHEQTKLLRRAKLIVQKEWLISLTMTVMTATLPLIWWVTKGNAGLSWQVVLISALAAVAANVLHALQIRLVLRILAGGYKN